MIANNKPGINPAHFRPGTVVSTPRPGFRHYGITTDRYIKGYPTVISNTSRFGKVVEESMGDFLGGYDLRIEGYWGSLPEYAVLARARGQLGTQYDLFSWNCEHFVRFVHGLERESPQIQGAVIGAVALGLLFVLAGT